MTQKSSSSDRTFRPLVPSDLPNVASGKLKAFRDGKNGTYFPVTLVGTKFHPLPDNGTNHTGWVVQYDWGDLFFYDNDSVVVDVTPVKRYAIWNHRFQRFCKASTYPQSGFTSKTDAEVWLKMASPGLMGGDKNYYIVEWEIKDDQV